MLRSQLTSIDVGNLLVEDISPLNLPKNCANETLDNLLSGICAENTQLLVDEVWKLSRRRQQDVMVVELPAGKTVLPREKSVPKPKLETRWDRFAKLKGITKRKKGRMEWDETQKEYVPRWGMGSKANEAEKAWLMEVPANLDPNTDMFAKVKKEKKERIAKNELNRLKNIQRSVKGKAAVGVLPGSTKPTKEAGGKSTALAKALSVAQVSDASMGQFSRKLEDENKKKYSRGGRKRQLDGVAGFTASDERKRAMMVLGELKKGAEKVDKSKAANKLQVEKEAKRRKAKEGGEKKGKLLSEMVSKRKANKKAGAKKFKNRYSRTGKKK